MGWRGKQAREAGSLTAALAEPGKEKKGGILPPFFIEHPYPSCAQLTSMSAILAVPCEALPVHEASLAKRSLLRMSPEQGGYEHKDSGTGENPLQSKDWLIAKGL